MMNQTATQTKADRIQTAESMGLQIRSHLCRSIMAGEFRPGDKLILRTLAARFGVSLTPIREALFNLVAEGVLVIGRNGTVVVPVMSRAELRELSEVRMSLESLAIRTAFPALSRSDLAQLKRINDKIAASVERTDVKTIVELNLNFHFTIYQAANAPFLLRLIESCWLRSSSYVAGIYLDLDSMRVTVRNHERILHELENGTPDSAAAALIDDLDHARQGFLRSIYGNDGDQAPDRP